MTLTIRRMQVMQDLVRAFKSDSVMDVRLTIIVKNAKGEEEGADDFGGVFRDNLSAFWDDFYKGHAVGENEMVPCIRHDFSSEEWKAVARILVKGFKDVGYFPLKLSKAFMIATLFGEQLITPEILFQSFFLYLPVGEQSLLKTCLEKEEIDINGEDEELIDLLQGLSSKRIVNSGSDLKVLISEIAHKELIQTPSYIREAWESIFIYNDTCIPNLTKLFSIYKDSLPTNKKVLKLFKDNASNDAERATFGYLRKFVKSLNESDLKTFLRFLTGADVLCPTALKNIEIMYTKVDGVGRTIVAHTCGPMLELPITYEMLC